MRRPLRRVALSVLLMASLALTATPAMAAPAWPETGQLIYDGTVTYNSAGGSDPWTGGVAVDCNAGLCTLQWDPEFEVVFDHGVASIDIPAAPLDCNNSGAGLAIAGQLSLTAETLTGTVGRVDRPAGECPGFHESVVIPGYSYTFDLVHRSGPVCLIDNSCLAAAAEPVSVDEALEAAAGPFAPGGRNRNPLPGGGDRPFAAPTELSQVATLDDVITPGNLAWAVGGTVVLGLLVIIPTALAGSAAETLVARLRAAWRRRRGLAETDDAPGLKGWRWAAAGVAAAAIISAFADPNFGLDAAALRVLLSILVAFGLEVIVGWVAVTLLVRLTTRTAKPTWSFSPLSLLVVAGATLLARVSGFEPAIVFGLIAGLGFTGLVTVAQNARVPLLTLGWAYLIGMLAWLGYSALDPSDPALVIVRELLAAAMLAGISALPIALLPLPGLPGRDIWSWRRGVWMLSYAIALFSFLLILLPLPDSWTEVGVGRSTWLVMFFAYCAGSLVVLLLAKLTTPKHAPQSG